MEKESERIYRTADYFKDDIPFVVQKLTMNPGYSGADAVGRRQFWKILYVISGEGVLKINNRRYPVSPGFVCLNHPDDLTVLELENDLVIHNILFHLKSIGDDLAKLYSDNRFFTVFRPEFRPENSLSHELLHLMDSNRTISALIRKMHREYNHTDANSGIMLRLLLLELLIEFARLSSRTYNRKRRKDAVAFIRGFLAEHYNGELDAERIAREIGISKGYLFTFCRNATGRTLGETLLEIRLEKAKELLLADSTEVKKICYRCGFSDISNFYKRFRRETGVSPGEFRKKR